MLPSRRWSCRCRADRPEDQAGHRDRELPVDAMMGRGRLACRHPPLRLLPELGMSSRSRPVCSRPGNTSPVQPEVIVLKRCTSYFSRGRGTRVACRPRARGPRGAGRGRERVGRAGPGRLRLAGAARSARKTSFHPRRLRAGRGRRGRGSGSPRRRRAAAPRSRRGPPRCCRRSRGISGWRSAAPRS